MGCCTYKCVISPQRGWGWAKHPISLWEDRAYCARIKDLREISLPSPGGAYGRAPAAVLVVDDEAGIRDVLAEVLRGAGYIPHCAEDGELGWDAFRTGRFDALITDHDMPRLTGLELIRRVRAIPHTVPVIFMSGKMPYEETVLAPLIHPGATLKKPFSIGDLLSKLSRILIPTAIGTPSDSGVAAAGGVAFARGFEEI